MINTRSPALISTLPSLSRVRPAYGIDFDILESQCAGLAFGEGDAVLPVMQNFRRFDRAAEACDAEQGRAPIGDDAEIIHEPAQGGHDLIEGADRQHHAAEGEPAHKIQRRGDDDRHDKRRPAIARGDPGEASSGR